MKELEYLNIIKNTLDNSSLLGDDCAYLPNNSIGTKGLYVTQDTLVEDVHFSLDTISPYLLGRKSINVNLSDLAATCATPLYLTISLSLPKKIDNNFIAEFYKGVNEVCKEHSVIVAGGDLTGSEKIMISITAIGKKTSNFKISRNLAKPNYVVVTTGFHGDSSAGFKLLEQNNKQSSSLINAHLNPTAQLDKSRKIASIAKQNFAMMDTSDGLADALYKIANASNVSLEIDLKNIPISKELKKYFSDTYINKVLWGGEDYQLLFCMNEEDYNKLENDYKNDFYKIGKAVERNEYPVKIHLDNDTLIIDKNSFIKNSYNHFGEQ